MGALYCLTFPSGKQYIGITTETVRSRFLRHVKKTQAGQKNAVNLAIAKYGAHTVQVRALVVADDWNYLCAMERRAIAVFETLSPNGYNLTSGGEGVPGLPCRNDTRRKISKANKGRVLTEEQRIKLVAALRRRGPPSEETRKKIAAGNTGKKHRAETKAKCGLANLGRVITPEEKKKQRETVFAKGGGVCFDKTRGKWLAYVKKDRKTKILGRFDTPEAARSARETALRELWG